MICAFNITDLDQKALYFKLKSSFEISDIESYIGLYSIHKNGVCVYVGQSKNIPSRLATHLKGKYKTADMVKIYLAVNNGFADINSRSKSSIESILTSNEKMLIKHLEPIENIIADYDFELSNSKSFHYFTDEDYRTHDAEILVSDSEMCFATNDEQMHMIIHAMLDDESMLGSQIRHSAHIIETVYGGKK